MATFLTLHELEEKITDIIFDAKEKLLILSPFIKLDDYFVKLFSNHIKNPEIHIIIVFGKNEDNKGKSLRKEDFEFLKQFPNISIFYLRDLHAKYYANESEGVVTSINLHDYSFKNNIEFGVYAKNNGFGSLNPLSDNLDNVAWDTAMDFARKAEAVFIKRPVIQKRMLGLSKNYVGSDVLFDNTELFSRNVSSRINNTKKCLDEFPDFVEFGKPQLQEKPSREKVENPVLQEVEAGARGFNNYSTPRPGSNLNQVVGNSGHCIRTGEAIPFNLKQPFTGIAFASWNRHKNVNYTEKFCHCCGSRHSTSMNKPLCAPCFYNSKNY